MMYSMTIIASLLGSALGFSSTPMDPTPTPVPTPMDMKVPCSTPVTVTVTVKDTWCKTSHPHDFMGNIGGDGPINGPFTPPDVKAGAHTSPTVVYTHGASAPPAYGGHATQGGAKVLKVCLVSGAAACSPGAALCCPALLGWTLQAPGCLTIRGLPHPGVADIATTGNPAVFIADMTSHFLTHWKGGPATSCGAVDPTPAQTSVDLLLNEQNTKVSAIQHAQTALGCSSQTRRSQLAQGGPLGASRALAAGCAVEGCGVALVLPAPNKAPS